MARSFIQSLLAAAVAVVIGGSALAQDPLKEAVTMMRLGKGAEAKARLVEILGSDPSNEDALKMYQSVTQDEFYMLLTDADEDVRKIAQSILERAKVERAQRSRDEAAIRPLVDAATAADTEYRARQAAINTLINQHGEFAVPALVEKLGDSDNDEGQVQAIYVLSQLHACAVLPLIAALESSKELVVQNAAAALHHIGDDRAIPAMAHLANDPRVGVSTIARRFLAKKAQQGSDVELLVAQARDYLSGKIPAGGRSDVVWSLVADKLVASDVDARLYPSELAKACAARAVAIAPQNLDARTVLALASDAQVTLIRESEDENLKALDPVAHDLRIAAVAAGKKVAEKAFKEATDRGDYAIAKEAIANLIRLETATSAPQSTLVQGLDSTDKRISYEAAAALVLATEAKDLPAPERVVAVLAQAVAEESVRSIRVIDPAPETKSAVVAAGAVRGNAVAADASAISGMGSLLRNPNVDVLVIRDILPDRMPEDVIGLVKKDPRMAHTKIVVVAKDVAAATARFGEAVHSVLQAPLTGEALVAEVNRVLDGVENPGGKRNEGYAAGASEALAALAKNGRIDGALGTLAKQLDRGDAVAVPAARALGLRGNATHLDALVAALKGGSLEVRKAAAEAIGLILDGSDSCPAGLADVLLGIAATDADSELRLKAAVALGRAKLEPAKAGEVQLKLLKIASAPKS
ncbi:MAG: hypothetical protein FJ265_13980 [Planctomycetes bacterium]|nr:hypothetical protein [Planctomycetota bacterium]